MSQRINGVNCIGDRIRQQRKTLPQGIRCLIAALVKALFAFQLHACKHSAYVEVDPSLKLS